MIQWDGHWVRFFRWLNDTKYKKVRYWLRIKVEYKRLCIGKESLLAKILDFFFSPTLLLKMSHRKMGIEVLLSKKKEMNSCNFWVITIAQWPVPTPPSQRKKKGANGFVCVFLSGGDWNTLSWDWERQGDTHRPPLPVQLQLGSGLGAWRGLLSPSVVLCRRTARCYHKFWRYRRKSANLLGPGFPHL